MGLSWQFVPFPPTPPRQFCPALGPLHNGPGSQKLPVTSVPPPCPPSTVGGVWGLPWLNPLHLAGFSSALASHCYRENEPCGMPLPIPLPIHLCPVPVTSLWNGAGQKGHRKGRKRRERERERKKGRKKKSKQKENQKPAQGCSGKSAVRAEAFRQPGLECLTHTVTKCKYELKPAP